MSVHMQKGRRWVGLGLRLGVRLGLGENCDAKNITSWYQRIMLW